MSRVIPRKVLDDIRFRNDIADVIGSYFELKRAGASYKALCPFHKEKTPSFHVNPQRQIFHCFGCGAGGDVFRFVMQHESVDFMTAARMLAQRVGIAVELDDDGEAGEDKAVLYRIHEAVADFYRRCLRTVPSAEVARAYLVRRQLDEAAQENFRVGYAPNRWDAMEQWAGKNKFRIEDLERAGLVVRNTKPGGHRFYDRFRHRVMFPVCDEQGRVIAFSGRVLEEDAKEAKYVNSPDSPLFHKNRTLYALDKARKPIVEAREAIVCEGQIDVIRCHLSGFTTAVASQGTAFTEEHARILRRYADSVCLVFDGDTAGQEAAIRTSETFLDAGLAVRVVSLPEEEDPDSVLLKSGPEAFRKALEASQSAVGFHLSVLSRREDLSTEVGAMRAAKAVLRTIGHSPNAVQRAKMVEQAAERLRVPAASLHEELRFLLQKTAARQEAQTEKPVSASPERSREELELCEHLVHVGEAPDLVELVGRYLPADLVGDPLCRTVVQVAQEWAAGERDLVDVLRDREDPSGELQKFVAALVMAPAKTRGEVSRADAVKALILRLWQRKFRAERDALQARTKAHALTRPEEERRAQLTRDLKNLDKWDAGVLLIEAERGA